MSFLCTPPPTPLEVTSTDGAEGAYDSSALAQIKLGPWGMLAAAGILGTDGYIQESPYQRGPVDVASNVHSQNALVDAEHAPHTIIARSASSRT